jgi:hypothetical protein
MQERPLLSNGDNRPKWITSRHQRSAAPRSGRRIMASQSGAAHTSARHIGMGYPHTDGAFRGIIVQEKRHEQSLADYRCRTRVGGGYR